MKTAAIQIEKLNEFLNDKKILQLGNLAGWPHTVSSGLCELGIDSENIIHEYRDVAGINRKLPYDSSIFSENDGLFFKVFKTLLFLKDAPKKYKVIHYHSSNILPRSLLFLEAAYLKYKGVKTVISFGGSDARLISEANSKNKYFFLKKDLVRDIKVRWRWFNWNRFVDACATDPEMLSTKMNKIKKKVLFMQPISFKRLIKQSSKKRHSSLIVMHVPTEPLVKGTSIFTNAMEKFVNKYDIDFICKRNIPQDEFYTLLAKADIYLDELKCGGHGVTAAEAMSLGKVVVTYIRDDLVDMYPKGLPVFNCNPDNLEQRLDDLFNDKKLIDSIQRKSSNYAENTHDVINILNNVLIPLYVDILDAD